MINHLLDLDLSRFRSIIHKTLAYQDSDQLFTRLGHIKTLITHLQDLGISKYMPIMSWICQSCQWLIRVLWMISRNTAMPKSCKWFIGVRICPNQGRTQNTRIRGCIECGRHDVSGIRCKGGWYERGFPPLIWGSGGYPPGKYWEIVVPEKRF